MRDKTCEKILLPWIGICPVNYSYELSELDTKHGIRSERAKFFDESSGEHKDGAPGSYMAFLSLKKEWLLGGYKLGLEKWILNVDPDRLKIQDWSKLLQKSGLFNFYQTVDQVDTAINYKENELKNYHLKELVKHMGFGVLEDKIIREVVKRRGLDFPIRKVELESVSDLSDSEAGSMLAIN